MSRENVEAVRRAWEAWKRRDMTALFEFYAPDIEREALESLGLRE